MESTTIPFSDQPVNDKPENIQSANGEEIAEDIRPPQKADDEITIEGVNAQFRERIVNQAILLATALESLQECQENNCDEGMAVMTSNVSDQVHCLLETVHIYALFCEHLGLDTLDAKHFARTHVLLHDDKYDDVRASVAAQMQDDKPDSGQSL